MYTIEKIKNNIVKKINNAVETQNLASLRQTQNLASLRDIVTPPNPAMGDFSFACFNIAKEQKTNPAEVATALAAAIKPDTIIQTARAAGPYVNFFVKTGTLAASVLAEVNKKNYGAITIGQRKKIIVEYACPNVNKQFHIGHVRNIVTGEAIIRLLENVGYNVVRVNYQGDVGLHIAKSIWGILKSQAQFEKIKAASLEKRVAFLGRAYAKGAQAYEDSDKAKAEINDLNRAVYDQDNSVMPVWRAAKKWSLEYFETVYKRFHSHFDYYFFESDMAARGVEIVRAGLKKGIFKDSDGAVIFAGSKYGLHDRVFVNSAGFPTYEAKDLALAELWFKKFKPALAVHVVGKEQTEYFKVVFKALEHTLPQSRGKEQHVSYGWVHLKSGKMSSRLGNVVTGDELLATVKKAIGRLAAKTTVADKAQLAENVTMAAVKYALLKADVDKDISFDMDESVSVSGNSGPYLLYTYARIKSILEKAKKPAFATLRRGKQTSKKTKKQNDVIGNDEKQLLLKLALFPEIAREAAAQYNPSVVAKYCFELAQTFNDYYHRVPVLQSVSEQRQTRLAIIAAVAGVLERCCYLLGFETVENM